jgi:type IV secretory pathway VirB9-like protein
LLALAVNVFAGTNLTLTVDGVTYSNVTFGTATPSWVSVRHASGAATIPLAKLPPDLQKQFGYDPEKAAQWQASQQEAQAEAARKKAEKIAEQQALEKKWAAAQRWNGAVDEILPDGIVVVMHSPGYVRQGSQPYDRQGHVRHFETVVDPQDFYILLVGHPKKSEFAEGNGISFYAYKDGVVTVGGDALEKWVYCEPPPGKK